MPKMDLQAIINKKTIHNVDIDGEWLLPTTVSDKSFISSSIGGSFLEKIRFVSTTFTKHWEKENRYSECHFFNCTFSECELKEIDYSNCIFELCTFKNCYLFELSFTQSILKNITFSGSEISSFIIVESNISDIKSLNNTYERHGHYKFDKMPSSETLSILNSIGVTKYF